MKLWLVNRPLTLARQAMPAGNVWESLNYDLGGPNMTLKRPSAIACITLAGLVAFAGCTSSPDNSPGTNAASGPAAPTSAGEAPSAQPSTPEADLAEKPTPSDSADDLDKYAVDTNIADGAVTKRVGEKVTMKTPTGQDYLTFAFTKFTPNYECTGPLYDGEAPKNGQFLAAEVTVTAGSKAAVDEIGNATLPLLMFDAQDENGKDFTSLSGSTFACLAPSDMVPVNVKPGQSAKGLAVFDVPEHGMLFAPGERTRNGTWAWEF